jgi:thymidylate synthase (FAD)
MTAKLVSVTKPCDSLATLGVKTADDLVAYCARVSNPGNQLNVETAPRLLAYCMRHGHWSVFETVSMTLELSTSRAIGAQLLRHRSFTFQEWSQRYSTSSAYEPIELRRQDIKNRQASGEVVKDRDLQRGVETIVEDAFEMYKCLVARGVSRETARMVLPLCTQTRIYMTGNARSWLHYFEQRCADGTQKEHRELAEAAREIFKREFPHVAAAAWKEAP